MTIFITGVAGFIGSHFAEFMLKQGHAVVGIDNLNAFYDPEIKRRNLLDVEKTAAEAGQKFSFYPTDIRQPSEVARIFSAHPIKAVIHLAAMAGVRPSMENPLLYEDVNQMGTIALFETARQAGVKKVVFASSSSVYGNASQVPFSETDPVNAPISHYAATKKAGELTCNVYHQIYGFSIAALRFFTVYGPRQRPDLAIHKFTKLMFDGKKIPIFGDGSKSRDFTYVDDIVDGIYKSLLWVEASPLPRFEIFNLGNSNPLSVLKLLELLESATGIKAQRDYQPDMPGDVDITFADLAKSKKVLGYDPQTPIEQGIPEFVRWFRHRHGVKA